jgi:hypothetical protein
VSGPDDRKVDGADLPRGVREGESAREARVGRYCLLGRVRGPTYWVHARMQTGAGRSCASRAPTGYPKNGAEPYVSARVCVHPGPEWG